MNWFCILIVMVVAQIYMRRNGRDYTHTFYWCQLSGLDIALHYLTCNHWGKWGKEDIRSLYGTFATSYEPINIPK